MTVSVLSVVLHRLIRNGGVVQVLTGGRQGPVGATGDTGEDGSITNLASGNDTKLLFADGTSLGYASGFTFNKTTGVVTVPGQVKFPATQSASADANTLDDYEEGTFTPALTFGGASVGLVAPTAQGFYTKVGREVEFHFRVQLSAKGSSTGTAGITGFPFAATAIPVQVFAAYMHNTSGVSGTPFLQIASGASSGAILLAGSFLSSTNFTDTTDLRVSGTYFTA